MSRDKKVLVLGIDGMDFRITKKFLDEGKLPNIKNTLRGELQEQDWICWEQSRRSLRPAGQH